MKTNPLRPVTPALPGALVRSVLYAAGVCWLAASDFATAQTEPPDFSNASPGTAYNLVNGANVFSGTVTTPTDLQDNFQVICPAGKRITGVSKTASGGSFNGSVTFNAESLSGPGTANFTTGFPFSAGTYQVTVAADFSTGTNWSVTVTVADAPNYTVTTTATSITVTDDAGNGDTLDVTMPAAGQIRFAAAGRTFSVNGGALISGNSGNLSLSGITSLTMNLGGGADSVNLGGFTGTALPGLAINASGSDDTVNVNGDLTLASNRHLELFNTATLNVAAGCNVLASGTGEIYVDCTRNVSLAAGASLETVNGDLWVEANQQTTAATGNFSGIDLSGAGTMLRTTGSGAVTVKGRGGNDAGGSQLGVGLFNGAKIIGGTSGAVAVTGTGGASTNIVNRGVTVYAAGSAITSNGAAVTVTGNAGALGSYYGIGVAILFGAEISAGGSAAVSVTGNGAGAAGSGFNVGVEMGGTDSKITSGGGAVTIIGSTGPGTDSYGLLLGSDAAITTPLAGGNIVIEADSMSVAATAAVTTLASASTTTLRTRTSTTRVNLGAADDNTGTPKVLGLTDAELDRITTPELIISSAGSATLNILAAISPANAPNLTLNTDASTGSVRPTVAGTDVTVTGTLRLDGPFLAPITGAAADTGFPQLKVTGGVNLNGRALDLTGTTLAGTVGQTFMLVDNDGTDAITGTFAGLPENSLLAWPGSPALLARISYSGGTGNDAMLTLVNTVEVTNTADTGPGSLRSAFATAASLAGANAITFAPSLSGQTITLATEITVADAEEVALDASSLPGGLTLSGGNATRHFSVPSGKFLVLRNLTLTGGNSGGASGGAILNNGTLHAFRCAFTGNTSGFGGGAIATLSATSQLVLENCTLAENSAAFGGAVWHDQSVAVLNYCTVARNHGTGGTGGIVLGPGNAVFLNTLVAENTGTVDPDLGGSGALLFLFGSNLFGQHEAAYAAALPVGAPNAGGDFVGTAAAPVNARLGTFTTNGGTTKTIALLPGSPALDPGTVIPNDTPATDQRGLIRTRDGNAVAGALPDIGAYEAQLAPVSLGFNFVGGGPAGTSGTLLATDLAGIPGTKQANWNNLSAKYDGSSTGSAPNAASRTDSNGSTHSGLRLWWDSPNTWGRAPPLTTGDQKLMGGYLDSNHSGDGSAATDLYTGSTAQPFFSVASLPGVVTLGGYKVVIYADGDATTGKVAGYWLATNRAQNPGNVSQETALTPRVWLRDNASFTSAYTRATAASDTGASTAPGNYVLFEGVAESAFTVRAEEGSTPAAPNGRAPLNAVQIVRNEVIVVTTAADELDASGTLGTGISLREAIRDAAPGMGIVFDPAVFNGEPADTIAFLTANPGFVLDKDLTIDASNISGGVTINAAGSNGNQKRHFTLPAGRTASLLGLNLTGGYNTTLDSGYGGAIHNQGRLSLAACRLTGNVATEGGAIFYHATATPQPSRLSLRRCVVSGNQGLGYAGAIEIWADNQMAELLLEDCTLSGNTTPGYGGAVWTYADGARCIVTARRTTVAGNQSYLGGAFNNQSVTTGSAELTLSHCTLAGNTASLAGGGIISANSSSPTAAATVTLAHTIIAGNSASSAAFGPDLIKDGGTITSGGGNLIGKTDASGTTWLGSDITGTAAAPLNALLAPLGNYGGPTQTIALLPGSSARNAAAGSTSTSDQRGFPIIGTPDIGAYEAGTFSNYNAYIWESLPTAGNGTFGDPLHAPNYDFDGDGVTNEAEWIMGSNAAQAVFGAAPGGVSVLVIVLASQQSDVLLGSILNRAPGRTYTLQHSDTLVSGSWVNVPGLNPLYGQGTDTWSIPISGADRRFYRVVVTKD